MKETINNTVETDMPEKCNSCSEFEASTKTVKYHANNMGAMTQTVVRCQHKEICDRLEKKLKEDMKPKGMPRFGA